MVSDWLSSIMHGPSKHDIGEYDDCQAATRQRLEERTHRERLVI